jgi:hypothetical protein
MHVYTQDVCPVVLAFQCHQVMIRRHQRQLADVADRMPRVDGDHDGVDFIDHSGQAGCIALLEQALQVLFEKRGVLFVTLAGE